MCRPKWLEKQQENVGNITRIAHDHCSPPNQDIRKSSIVEGLLHFKILSGQFNMIIRWNEVCHAFWLPFRKDANNKNDNELSISNWIKNQPPLM